MMKIFGFGKKTKKLFGLALEQASEMAPPEAMGIPLPIFRGVQFIENKHLESEGIYRVSGAFKFVEQLIKLYDSGQDPDLNKFDPYVVSGIVKRFLTMLPTPLMTFELHDQFVKAQRNKDKAARRNEIIQLIAKLPKLNRDIFVFILKHLKKVCDFKSENKMGPSNLAIVFGPTLFRSRDNDAYRMLEETGHLSGLVQTFLNDFASYFPEEGGNNNSGNSDNNNNTNNNAASNGDSSSAPQMPFAPTADAIAAANASHAHYLRNHKRKASADSSMFHQQQQPATSGDRKSQRKSLLVGIHGEAIETMDVSSILQNIAQNDANTVDVGEMFRGNTSNNEEPAELKRFVNDEEDENTVADQQSPSDDKSSAPTTCVSTAITSSEESQEEANMRQFISNDDTAEPTTAAPRKSLIPALHIENIAPAPVEEPAQDKFNILQQEYDMSAPLECSNKRLEAMRLMAKRPEEIYSMNTMQLSEEHKCLKKELKLFEKSFEAKYYKEPSREDKSILRPLYKRYQLVKKRMTELGQEIPMTPRNGVDGDSFISPYSPLNKLLANSQAVDGSSPMKTTAHARRKSVKGSAISS